MRCLVGVGLALATGASPASAQMYFDVYPLSGGAEGRVPSSALIQARDGNFYGTTATGGGGVPCQCGTVFKVTSSGALTVVHAFGGSDGATPNAALIQASDGNFYGTTTFGGAANAGTVFRMTIDGTVTVLHSFVDGTDGAYPYAPLVEATDGNFYGTTSEGGRLPFGFGTIFRMTPGGTVTILRRFALIGGSVPHAALIQATDGSLYGMTPGGGFPCDCGTVFKMTLAGSYTLLHAFDDATEGSYPYAALLEATDGNFYGTTSSGGDGGAGTAFRMTPDGTVTVLHAFSGGSGESSDGAFPNASLIQANDGGFYGTTESGGASGDGTVFKLTPGGTVTVLHAFSGGSGGGTDGAFPAAAVIQAADGNLYGTTPQGGGAALDSGVVFRLGTTPLINRSFTADFDGDRRSDLVVYRPSTGTWFIRYSSNGYSYATATVYQWGLDGDVPLVTDFDGDGRTDLAVYRPSTGEWFIRYSSNGYSYATATVYQWGVPGDVPLAADFDGDGRTDLAVYRPSTGEWFIRYSSRGYSYAAATIYQWGLIGDIPLVADFDGDNRTDLVVYRPSTGTWFIRYSSSGYSYATAATYQWGATGDIPLVTDIDGDGRTDLAVWRRSSGNWQVRFSSSHYAGSASFQWGASGDVPIQADFDGDKRTDLTVWRPSNGTWYLRFSSAAYNLAVITWYQWGAFGDEPR